MKKLLVLLFTITGCATTNFNRGDCLKPNPKTLESWEQVPPDATILILNVGKNKYQVFSPTPMGWMAQSADINVIDKYWIKKECPVGVDQVLVKFPNTNIVPEDVAHYPRSK